MGASTTADRRRLDEIMRRLRHGDEAAVFTLHDAFGAPIRAALAAIARRRGYRWLRAADLDELTVEACLLLARLAGGWRPQGGALPWTWAQHRLVNLVDAFVGPRTACFDEEELGSAELARPAPTAWAGDDPEAVDCLRHLAARDESAALLSAALDEAVPRRDHEVLLRYQLQLGSGDPSPSHTVGAELGLAPPAVRQRVSRARHRLRSVVEADARYAPLAGLPLLHAA